MISMPAVLPFHGASLPDIQVIGSGEPEAVHYLLGYGPLYQPHR